MIASKTCITILSTSIFLSIVSCGPLAGIGKIDFVGVRANNCLRYPVQYTVLSCPQYLTLVITKSIVYRRRQFIKEEIFWCYWPGSSVEIRWQSWEWKSPRVKGNGQPWRWKLVTIDGQYWKWKSSEVYGQHWGSKSSEIYGQYWKRKFAEVYGRYGEC